MCIMSVECMNLNLTLGRRKMLDLQCIICCCRVKKKLRIYQEYHQVENEVK